MTEVRFFARNSGRVIHAELGQWIVKHSTGHFSVVEDNRLLSIYDRVQPVMFA